MAAWWDDEYFIVLPNARKFQIHISKPITYEIVPKRLEKILTFKCRVNNNGVKQPSSPPYRHAEVRGTSAIP